MMDHDVLNDSLDEYASPEQREEMRELGIDPDKHRLITPVIWYDTGDRNIWKDET